MTEDDITDRYLSWFRDQEVTQFLESNNISKNEALEFLHWGEATNRRILYAVCVEGSDLHIGNVKLGDIDVKSSISDLVTVIGDKEYWGKGLATTSIKIGTEIAFKDHKLRKLHGSIYSDNIGSLKAYTRAGWVIEAVIYQDVMGATGPMDRIRVSCFNPALYPTLPKFPLPLPE